MKNTSLVGKHGEDIACEYLISKRYKILARNWRKQWGEIDIVARAPDTTLVFCEVKALSHSDDFKPEDHLNKKKMANMKKIGEFYARENEKEINPETGWRIDLIAIDLTNGERNVINNSLRHFENI